MIDARTRANFPILDWGITGLPSHGSGGPARREDRKGDRLYRIGAVDLEAVAMD